MKKEIFISELIFIFLIIFFLGAIIYPVFAVNDKEKAREMICIGNLKRIGDSAIMYTENYGAFPTIAHSNYSYSSGSSISGYGVTANSYNGVTTWADMLKPYADSEYAFYCPSYKGILGYGVNQFLSNSGEGIKYSGTFNNENSFSPTYRRLIKDLANTVFATETLIDNGKGYLYVTPQMIVDGNVGSVLSGTFSTPERHNGIITYVFCDGHIQRYKKTEGPCANNNWDIGYAGENSPYWNYKLQK